MHRWGWLQAGAHWNSREQFNRQPMSENIRKSKLRIGESECNLAYLTEISKFIDLEIAEIELAD